MPFDSAAADADGDGVVTPEEIETRQAARFAEADADGDSDLSAEELLAMEAQRAVQEAPLERLPQMPPEARARRGPPRPEGSPPLNFGRASRGGLS